MAGISKPTKANELKPSCYPKPSGYPKLAGLLKPEKSVAKVGSSTRAEVAKKKSASMATVFGESL